MKIEDCKVLIVDDEEAIRSIMTTFFTKYKKAKEVFAASNADEALEIINKEAIDLIISDKNMSPGFSGLRLLEKVRQNQKESIRQICFILLTAHLDNNAVKEAITKGANAFLQKPLSLSELQEVIEKL